MEWRLFFCDELFPHASLKRAEGSLPLAAPGGGVRGGDAPGGGGEGSGCPWGLAGQGHGPTLAYGAPALGVFDAALIRDEDSN